MASQKWYYNKNYDLALIQLSSQYPHFNKIIKFATFQHHYINLIQQSKDDLFVYGYSTRVYTQQYNEQIHILNSKFIRIDKSGDWIYYDSTTEKGMSGGPLVYSLNDDQVIVCGLHVSRAEDQCKSLCFTEGVVQQINAWIRLEDQKVVKQGQIQRYFYVIKEQKQEVKKTIKLLVQQYQSLQDKIDHFQSLFSNKQHSNTLTSSKNIISQNPNDSKQPEKPSLPIKPELKPQSPALPVDFYTFSKKNVSHWQQSDNDSNDELQSYDSIFENSNNHSKACIYSDIAQQPEEFNHKIQKVICDKNYATFVDHREIKYSLFLNHFNMIEYLEHKNLNHLAHITLYSTLHSKEFSFAYKQGDEMYRHYRWKYGMEGLWKQGRKAIFSWIISNIELISQFSGLNIYNVSLQTIQDIKLNQIYQVYQVDLAFKLKTTSPQDKRMYNITRNLIKQWLCLQKTKNMKPDLQNKLQSLNIVITQLLLKNYDDEMINRIKQLKQKYHKQDKYAILHSKQIVNTILELLNKNLNKAYTRHLEFRLQKLFSIKNLASYHQTIEPNQILQIKRLVNCLLDEKLTLAVFKDSIEKMYRKEKIIIAYQDNRILTQSCCKYDNQRQAFQSFNNKQELGVFKQAVLFNDTGVYQLEPDISNLLIHNAALLMQFSSTQKPQYFSRFYFKRFQILLSDSTVDEQIESLLIVTRNDSLDLNNDILSWHVSPQIEQMLDIDQYPEIFFYSFVCSLEKIFDQLERFQILDVDVRWEAMGLEGKVLKLRNLIGCIYLEGQPHQNQQKRQISQKQRHLRNKLQQNTTEIINILFKSPQKNILKTLFPHLSHHHSQHLSQLIKQNNPKQFLSFLSTIRKQYHQSNFKSLLQKIVKQSKQLQEYIKNSRCKIKERFQNRELRNNEIVFQWIDEICGSR